ncbi:MAG: cytochrome c [Planctomycetes bacterium]|nr:cytochrome c [Planctomycetota bacterium]
MRLPLVSAATCGGVVLLVLSCGPESPRGPQAADVSPPARHAIHSEQLRTVMRQVGSEVRESWPQEIAQLKQEEAARDRRERFEHAAYLANRLAEAAHVIPQAAPVAQLGDDDRRVFMDLVRQLQSESELLRSHAAIHDEQGMRRTLDRIRATCTNCHQQFRELAGPLRFGW